MQTTPDRQELAPNAHNEWGHEAGGRPLMTLFRYLLLTDSCSLFSAILRIQHRPQDKCAKLAMGRLRALQTLIDLSYVDNSYKSGDIETKNAGSLNITTQYSGAGRCAKSYRGRMAPKALGIHERHSNP